MLCSCGQKSINSPALVPSPLAGVGKAEYTSAVLGKGLPASPGAAVGRVVFSAEDAEKWDKDGEQVRWWLRGAQQRGWG